MKSFATILLLFTLPSVYAQQGASTMFWNNYTSFNPAASGLYEHQGSVNYRHYSNYGKSLTANYSTKLKVLHGGIGVNYKMEEFKPSKQNVIDVNYSYHVQLGNNILAAGVSAGVINIKERYAFTGSQSAVNENAFTTNAGIIFTNQKLIAGLSSTILNAPRFKNVINLPSRSYHLTAGYSFNITEKFKLSPQVLFSTGGGFSTLDVNLLARFNKFWLGSTYRVNHAVCFMAGYDIQNKFRIGYSCDLNKSRLNNSRIWSTHEFTLGFFLRGKSATASSYAF